MVVRCKLQMVPGKRGSSRRSTVDDVDGSEIRRSPVRLPETNSKFAPENRPGPKMKISIETIIFQVLC